MNATVRRQYKTARGLLSPNRRTVMYTTSPDIAWIYGYCLLSHHNRIVRY